MSLYLFFDPRMFLRMLKMSYVLLCGVLIFFLGFLFSFYFFMFSSLKKETFSSQKEICSRNCLPLVGQSLFLSQEELHPSLKNLKEEMEISLLPQRPDSSVFACYEFAFIHSDQNILVQPEKRLGIIFDREKGIWRLNGDNEDLYLIFHFVDERSVKIEIGTTVFHPLLHDFHNSIDWIDVQPALSEKGQKFLSNRSIFCDLKQAKWWGEDQIFSHLYAKGQSSIRHCIEFSNHHLLSIAEKECLVWKEGRWQTISDLKEAKGLPIAMIRSIEGNRMCIEGWDETGSNFCRFMLCLQSFSPWHIKPEEWIGSIRMQSHSQVNIQFEKQRLFLREGMWAYRKRNRWYWSRREPQHFKESDIDLLFYLHSISEHDGKRWIKAFFFDDKGVIARPLQKEVEKRGYHRRNPLVIQTESAGRK